MFFLRRITSREQLRRALPWDGCSRNGIQDRLEQCVSSSSEQISRRIFIPFALSAHFTVQPIRKLFRRRLDTGKRYLLNMLTGRTMLSEKSKVIEWQK